MVNHVIVLGKPWSRPDARGLPPRHKQLVWRLYQFWLALNHGYRPAYARRGFNRLLKVAYAWGMEVREHPDRARVSANGAADPMADFRTDRPDCGEDQ